MRESGLLKRGEEGDEDVGDDDDVDEDDRRDDGSPGGTPAPPREKGREAPLRLAPPWPPPLMGRGSPLWSLASMAPGGVRAPLRLDLFSLCFSVFHCFFGTVSVAEHRFFYRQRSITPIGLKILHDFFSIN